MAPNKKKRGSNKQKGGGGKLKVKQQQQSSSSSHNQNNSFRFDPEDSFGGGQSGSSSPQQQEHEIRHRSGLFLRYKRATQAVRDWYASILPAHFRLEYVNDLTRAADHVLETNLAALEQEDSEKKSKQSKKSNKKNNKKSGMMIVAPVELLDNLNECIELRHQVSKSYQQEADEGHRYIIDCLKYCRKLLRMSQRTILCQQQEENKKTDGTNQDQGGEEAVLGGRYTTLLQDSDEEEEQDEAATPSEYFQSKKKPQAPPAPTKEMLLDELINGDDRFHAMAFLSQVADLMNLLVTVASSAKTQFDELFKYQDILNNNVKGRHPSSYEWFEHRPHLHLMNFTLVCNMILERVQILEAELMTEHPHLDTFYKILGLLFLQPQSIELQRDIPASVLRRHPHIVKDFVGEVVAMEFGHGGNTRQAHTELVRVYAKKFQIDRTVLQEHCKMISTAAGMERATDHELKKYPPGLVETLAQGGMEPCSWMLRMGTIGGENSILNTQFITQSIFEVAAKMRCKLFPGRGAGGASSVFGELWDEDTNPADGIRGSMDSLLAKEILPELIECARDKGFSHIPYQESLCPLLGMMSAHFDRGLEKPVPLSLTFGLHAMLFSMQLMQGNGTVARLGRMSKASFEKLFSQLEEVSQSKQELPPKFFKSVNHWKRLRAAPEVIVQPVSSTSELNAFWNPLVGGSFLLFGTFIASVGVGSETLDCFGQLRLTLQMYNAFEKLGLLKSDDVPVLNKTATAFAREKGIWTGTSPPDKGNFMKSSLLSIGYSNETATRFVHVVTSEATGSEINTSFTRFQREIRNEKRQTNGIVPKRYSAVWRHLILRDFEEEGSFLPKDEEDPVEKEKKESERKGLAEMLSTMNGGDPDDGGKDDKKHMEDVFDQLDNIAKLVRIDGDCLIPQNLPVLGALYSKFLDDFSEHMGWKTEIDRRVAMCPDGERHTRISTSGMRVRNRNEYESSDASLAREYLADHAVKLLARADLFGKHDTMDTADGLYDVKQAANFMKFYFSDTRLKKEDYTFLVQPKESTNIQASVSAMGSMTLKGN